MVRSADERSSFRCSVPPENSAAKLRIGRKYHNINITETSRDSFTACMPQATFESIGAREDLKIYFSGEVWTVRRCSDHTYPNSGVPITKVGFKRLKELTPFKQPSSSFFQLFTTKSHGTTDPTFLMYLMLAFLFACLALPGMGDNLGTAPRIRDGVQEIARMIASFF